MGATTFPDATATMTAPVERGRLGVAFLSIGAVDAVLIGLMTLVWIFDPATAPGWRAVAAAPLMALATLTASAVIRRRLPDDHRSADLLASTARWWSLFGLLLSIPAILIITSA